MSVINFKKSGLGVHQGGVSLIEVLIAMLVLAIGLLGLASLQSNGLRMNQSAYLRSQASILAYDIVDRMRANESQATANAYLVALGAAPGAVCSAACTPAQITATDIVQWKAQLAAQLPTGDGFITLIGADRFAVNVIWADRDGNNTTFRLEVQI